MNYDQYIDLNQTDLDLTLPVEIRVKQGMALLDEKHGPRWVWRISLDSLMMLSTCRCVLGQLYGTPEGDGSTPGYVVGKNLLGLHQSQVVEYGFTLNSEYGSEYGWDVLTDAWKAAIVARRAELASA